MLKGEIKRALTGKGMLVALLIGALCVYYKSSEYFNNFEYCNMYLKSVVNPDAQWFETFNDENFWVRWFPNNLGPHDMYLFYFMGIIVTLPFGISYFMDVKSGLVKNICTRTGRTTYLRSKYIATFIAGGIVNVFPLLIDFLYIRLVIPVDNWELCNRYLAINEDWKVLMIEHPYIAALIVAVLWFVFGGALATIALAVSCVSKNVFTIQLVPFLVMLVDFEFEARFPVKYQKWFPIQFLRTHNSIIWTGFIVSAVMICLTYMVFVVWQSKRDIL